GVVRIRRGSPSGLNGAMERPSGGHPGELKPALVRRLRCIPLSTAVVSELHVAHEQNTPPSGPRARSGQRWVVTMGSWATTTREELGQPPAPSPLAPRWRPSTRKSRFHAK